MKAERKQIEAGNWFCIILCSGGHGNHDVPAKYFYRYFNCRPVSFSWLPAVLWMLVLIFLSILLKYGQNSNIKQKSLAVCKAFMLYY